MRSNQLNRRGHRQVLPEAAVFRAMFMVTGYMLGYLLYPSRIIRTIRNVFLGSHEAATVFEHRFKDTLNRLKVLARSPLKTIAEPSVRR